MGVFLFFIAHPANGQTRAGNATGGTVIRDEVVGSRMEYQRNSNLAPMCRDQIERALSALPGSRRAVHFSNPPTDREIAAGIRSLQAGLVPYMNRINRQSNFTAVDNNALTRVTGPVNTVTRDSHTADIGVAPTVSAPTCNVGAFHHSHCTEVPAAQRRDSPACALSDLMAAVQRADDTADPNRRIWNVALGVGAPTAARGVGLAASQPQGVGARGRRRETPPHADEYPVGDLKPQSGADKAD